MNTTMSAEGLKMRHPVASAPATVQPISIQEKKAEQRKKVEAAETTETPHPGGEIKHGFWVQALRMLLLFMYFNGGCIA